MFDAAFGAAFEQLQASGCAYDDSFDSSFDVCAPVTSSGGKVARAVRPRRIKPDPVLVEDEELLWII